MSIMSAVCSPNCICDEVACANGSDVETQGQRWNAWAAMLVSALHAFLMHAKTLLEGPVHLCLGCLGHMQGKEVGRRESLFPADQLHSQGRCLDLGGVGVIRYHIGKAQADASSGNLAAHLHSYREDSSAGFTPRATALTSDAYGSYTTTLTKPRPMPLPPIFIRSLHL